MKRTWPSALASCGPVKTSPAGHVAPAVGVDPGALATPRRRSVPSASMRSSWRAESRPMRRVLEGAQAAPGRDGVGLVEEQRALDEGARSRRRPCPPARRAAGGRPQRRAPAPAHASPRAAALRARATRAIRSGSTPASSRAFAGAWIRQRRVGLARLVARRSGHVVEVAVARVGVEARAPAPGSSTRSSGQASRSRIARCSSSSSGARQRRRPHEDLLAGLRPPGSSRPAGRRTPRGRALTAPAARGSARRGARAGRRGSKRRSSCVATRKRASSSRWPSVGTSGDRPSARPGARTGTRPRAARRPRGRAGCRRASRRTGCRVRGVMRAAQRQHLAVRPRVVAGGRVAERLGLTSLSCAGAAALAHPAAAPRRK